MRPLVTLTALLLAACSSGSNNGVAFSVSIPTQQEGSYLAPADYSNATAWTIGPIINGVNYSKSMPLHPEQYGDGFRFTFPNAPGEIDYLTYLKRRDISQANAITLRYEITGNGQFVTSGDPNGTPRMALYFQRAGDNWSAQGVYEHYRWYSQQRVILRESQGIQTFSVPLTPENWASVYSTLGTEAREAFLAAKRNVENVGVVFGGGGGAGHGVYVTDGTAHFIAHEFKVE